MGSKQLGRQLEEQLRAQGRKPYVIPIGGSDAIGTLGYLAATQEILDQAGKGAFTDIINVGSTPLSSAAVVQPSTQHPELQAQHCRCSLLSAEAKRCRKLESVHSEVALCETSVQCVQACGSGGTTAGLALGNHLSGMGATIHAYGVCDDEDYFYDFIDNIFKDLGATPDRIGGVPSVMKSYIHSNAAKFSAASFRQCRLCNILRRMRCFLRVSAD